MIKITRKALQAVTFEGPRHIGETFTAAIGNGSTLTADIAESSQFVTVWLDDAKPVATLQRRRVLDRASPNWSAYAPCGKLIAAGPFVAPLMRAIVRRETARAASRDASRAARAALWSAYRYGANA